MARPPLLRWLPRPAARTTGPYRSGEGGSGEPAPGPTRAGRRRPGRRRPQQPRGTPAGAHDAVGCMGAAIVGTQRRAERAAATRGRCDHQSRSPPQRPRRGSGIRGQSGRGSRAGRRADQCRAALRQRASASSRRPNRHGHPQFPDPPTLPSAGTRAAGGAEQRPAEAARPAGQRGHLASVFRGTSAAWSNSPPPASWPGERTSDARGRDPAAREPVSSQAREGPAAARAQMQAGHRHSTRAAAAAGCLAERRWWAP